MLRRLLTMFNVPPTMTLLPSLNISNLLSIVIALSILSCNFFSASTMLGDSLHAAPINPDTVNWLKQISASLSLLTISDIAQ